MCTVQHSVSAILSCTSSRAPGFSLEMHFPIIPLYLWRFVEQGSRNALFYPLFYWFATIHPRHSASDITAPWLSIWIYNHPMPLTHLLRLILGWSSSAIRSNSYISRSHFLLTMEAPPKPRDASSEGLSTRTKQKGKTRERNDAKWESLKDEIYRVYTLEDSTLAVTMLLIEQLHQFKASWVQHYPFYPGEYVVHLTKLFVQSTKVEGEDERMELRQESD